MSQFESLWKLLTYPAYRYHHAKTCRGFLQKCLSQFQKCNFWIFFPRHLCTKKNIHSFILALLTCTHDFEFRKKVCLQHYIFKIRVEQTWFFSGWQLEKQSWVPPKKTFRVVVQLDFYPSPNPKNSQLAPDILECLVQIKRVTRLRLGRSYFKIGSVCRR